MQAVLRTIIPRGVRLIFFSQNPSCATYFLSTATKSKQKGPLGEHKCERRSKAQASATPVFILWWLHHCFSTFKVSAQIGLFLG